MNSIFTSPDNSHNTCEVSILFATWSHWSKVCNVTPQKFLTYFLSRVKSQLETQYPVRSSSVLDITMYLNHSQGITLTSCCRMTLFFLFIVFGQYLFYKNVHPLVFQYGARMPASLALAGFSGSRVYCTFKRKYLNYLSLWENGWCWIFFFYPFLTLIRKGTLKGHLKSPDSITFSLFPKAFGLGAFQREFKFDVIIGE